MVHCGFLLTLIHCKDHIAFGVFIGPGLRLIYDIQPYHQILSASSLVICAAKPHIKTFIAFANALYKKPALHYSAASIFWDCFQKVACLTSINLLLTFSQDSFNFTRHKTTQSAAHFSGMGEFTFKSSVLA